MASPGWDSLVRETSIAARRRRRRRRQRRLRWLLAAATTAVLGGVAVLIMGIGRVPTVARPAALSTPARTLSHGAKGASSRRAHRPAIALPQVTDVTSGLSYQLFSSPWKPGCPSDLITPEFNWSAGENTVAGHVAIGGSVIDWHGVACSGTLQQQFSYAGPPDLQPAAMSLLDALDPAYYAGVPHSRTIENSSAMQVSGHQGWIVTFSMTYPDGASQGLTWSSELGAVVVVDRGVLQAPAVFYVSVPASLGTQKVSTLVHSLRLSSTLS